MKILPLIFPAFLTLLAAVSYAGAEHQQATFSVGGCCRFPHPQRGIKEIQLNFFDGTRDGCGYCGLCDISSNVLVCPVS